MLSLATPLPPGVPAQATDLQEALYPGNSVIDSISMISICLRRPEFVARAYQIFRQILEDAAKGMQRMPEADVWGRVIEGVAALGKGSAERAANLVERWEALEKPSVGGRISKNGLKVYQGWFAGTVRWVEGSPELMIDPHRP